MLRRDLAREIRRYRPDVLLIATHDPTYGLSPEQRIVNQSDHRAVGIATLDAAARDSANRWIFPELVDEGFEAWPGVRPYEPTAPTSTASGAASIPPSSSTP